MVVNSVPPAKRTPGKNKVPSARIERAILSFADSEVILVIRFTTKPRGLSNCSNAVGLTCDKILRSKIYILFFISSDPLPSPHFRHYCIISSSPRISYHLQTGFFRIQFELVVDELSHFVLPPLCQTFTFHQPHTLTFPAKFDANSHDNCHVPAMCLPCTTCSDCVFRSRALRGIRKIPSALAHRKGFQSGRKCRGLHIRDRSAVYSILVHTTSMTSFVGLPGNALGCSSAAARSIE